MSHNHPAPKPPEKKEVITINETVVIIEGQEFRRHDHEGAELKIIERLIRIIEKMIPVPKPVFQGKQVLIAIINNQKLIIMDPLQLAPGTQAPIIPALVDAITLAPIPGATFVPKSNSVDNSAVASVDASNNLVYVGAGSANLTSVNTWTYVDQNTQQPVTVDETTVAPVVALAAAETVQQTLSLGTAVPIGTV